MLVLALANFVPIVGPLGVLGYVLEWARLTAWGVDSAPKQKGVRVGECISSGWRGFVAILGWAILWGIIGAILSSISLFGLLNFAVFVAGIFVNTLLDVCAIRATIYQRIGAGYRADRIADMVKADFEGIARVTGIRVVMQVVIGFVVGLLALIAFMPLFLQVAVIASRSGYTASGSLSQAAISAMISSISQAIPAFVIMAVICSILATAASLISTTAAALWVRNFDVPSWGNSEDPIPSLANAVASSAPAPAPTATNEASSASPVNSVAPVAHNPASPAEEERVAIAADDEAVIEEISLTQPATSEADVTSGVSAADVSLDDSKATAKVESNASEGGVGYATAGNDGTSALDGREVEAIGPDAADEIEASEKAAGEESTED